MDKRMVLAGFLLFLLGGCVSKTYVEPRTERETVKDRVIVQDPAPKSDTTIVVPR